MSNLRSHPDEPGACAMRDLLTGKLVNFWRNVATEAWPWFETSVTQNKA